MKRVIKYFVLLPFLSACVQESVNEPTLAPDTAQTAIMSFEAQIASPEDLYGSKTALGEKYDGKYYPNYWSTGDAISVNVRSAKAVATHSTVSPSAVFPF